MDVEERETKNRILEVAAVEFLDKGFRGASLRNIAREAGVTTGSFYWHYKNKNELFDALVGESYNHILQMYDDALERFWKMSKPEQKEHMGDIGGECMLEMTAYMYQHQREFKLLLTCSAGTCYEHLIHELTEREIESTHQFEDHMRELGHSVSREIEPMLEHSLISGMFTGMFEMIIHDVPEDTAKKCVRQIHDFYTAGWLALMGI